jgi:hypothetical protein
VIIAVNNTHHTYCTADHHVCHNVVIIAVNVGQPFRLSCCTALAIDLLHVDLHLGVLGSTHDLIRHLQPCTGRRPSPPPPIQLSTPRAWLGRRTISLPLLRKRATWAPVLLMSNSTVSSTPCRAPTSHSWSLYDSALVYTITDSTGQSANYTCTATIVNDIAS